MNQLENQYKHGKMNSDDLEKLREMLDTNSDMEVGTRMEEAWEHEDVDCSQISDKRMTNVWNRVQQRIPQTKVVSFDARKWFTWAAAVLLPLLLLTTVYFYRENTRIEMEQVVVKTGVGERTTVILPDGTQVSLNHDTRLVYTPGAYDKSERRVQFLGEGYFEVVHNQTCPFYIDSKLLTVKVTGTKFNLRTRMTDTTSELMLKEGHVILESAKTHENVSMQQGQRARLDTRTGHIVLDSKPVNVRYIGGWKRGSLVFKLQDIGAVLDAVEASYGVDIQLNVPLVLTDRFTGTLPTDDLPFALRIISEAYQLKYHIQGHKVSMTK
uniref:FecR domain-containing protein n=1 Tax=Prevotella sp. GTC17254 TaxID=3236794 RepID=A0AB33IVM9_9BACT